MSRVRVVNHFSGKFQICFCYKPFEKLWVQCFKAINNNTRLMIIVARWQSRASIVHPINILRRLIYLHCRSTFKTGIRRNSQWLLCASQNSCFERLVYWVKIILFSPLRCGRNNFEIEKRLLCGKSLAAFIRNVICRSCISFSFKTTCLVLLQWSCLSLWIRLSFLLFNVKAFGI